jgi:ribosomal protein S12 methylthiotransferase accessory factor YcaO
MLKVDGISRCIPAAVTLENVSAVAESLGVTRLADITGLDRVGIPVYSAVVPDSRDLLSVYNGKGSRPVDAKAGALMEAIERQTALNTRLPFIEGSFAKLQKSVRVLDPNSLNQQLAANYSEDRIYCWTEGLDIVSGQPCWVPSKLAGFLWHDLPHASPFAWTDTNGLASGNNREEAICHALCELAERDAWTEVELGAHHLPRQRRLFVLGPDGDKGPDDLEMFPCVEIDSEAGCKEMLASFWQAGLFPVVRDITSSLGIPTIFASVADETILGYPMAHSGLGAHPDARVALRRALTELAQSRCVDIQAVREDIAPPDSPADCFSLHTRRISQIHRESWYLGRSKTLRNFSEIPSYSFRSVGEDLQFLLERFASADLTQVIVIDFTPQTTTHSVIRVIVPGIESWALDRGRFGRRALDFWKRHV